MTRPIKSGETEGFATRKQSLRSDTDMTGIDAGMYTEVILDYYRHPPNKGKIENADAKFKDWNPLCGDEVEVYLKFNSKNIADFKFEGDGCAISQASTAMLGEYLVGKPTKEVEKMSNDEVLGLLHINVTPVRTKCALLGFNAFKKAIHWHEKGIKSEEEKRLKIK